MSVLKIVAAGIPLLALGACARSGAARGSMVAAGHAVVDDARGSEIGVATLTQDAGGIVHIAMKVHGLTPGMHGVHFHAVGSCVAPAFASAGGHFNPDSKHHGINNPAGPHAGDLPNMMVDASGNADCHRQALLQLAPGITSRELDVCTRLLAGMTHDGVACDLGISATTVKTYRNRAFARLGIHHNNALFALVLGRAASVTPS